MRKKITIVFTYLLACIGWIFTASANPNLLLLLSLVTLIWGASSGLIVVVSSNSYKVTDISLLQITLVLASLSFCLGCLFYSGFFTLKIVAIFISTLCGIIFGVSTASVLIMLHDTY